VVPAAGPVFTLPNRYTFALMMAAGVLPKRWITFNIRRSAVPKAKARYFPKISFRFLDF
jgi:hypothetical protein